MERITFKNLHDYLHDEDIYKAISDMPYAMACAVIDSMGILPVYEDIKESHVIDDNHAWQVFEFDAGYIELQTSITGNFVNRYDTLDMLINANDTWLTYDEEIDDFHAIDEEDDEA